MAKPLTGPPLEVLHDFLSYDPETGVFTRRRRCGNAPAGKVAGTLRPDGYIAISVKCRRYLAHRLAYQFATGNSPQFEIDHINGDKADNRIANLREVTRRTNQENWRGVSKRKKDSRFLGVSRHHSGRWYAQIGVNYTTTNLGVFDTEEEAHQCYLEAKRRLHEGCTI